MTIAGHILDLYCVHKKVPFLANIERCPKFLEYALYSYFMLNKFILMQCRNFKIMWLIITDKDTISTSDGYIFSTDLLLSIINILSTTHCVCSNNMNNTKKLSETAK